MPEYIQPQSPEEYDEHHEANMVVFHLADMLESYASMYSEDYAEGYEDGCMISRGSTELDGLLTSHITFEANRLRDSSGPSPEVPGDVKMMEYNIKSVVRQDGILYRSLPKEVIAYLEEFEDFAVGEYTESTEAALEYEQSYFVTSKGEFMFESSFAIYLDGDGVSLPEYISEFNSEEPDTQSKTGEEQAMSEVADDLLADVFGKDELIALRALSQQVVAEHQASHPVYRFYDRMEEQRFLTRPLRVKLAGNIVKQMFSDAA